MFRVSKQLFYAISDMMICNVMLCYQSSNSLSSIYILCLYCTIWCNTQLQTLPLITILKIMTILIVKQILYRTNKHTISKKYGNISEIFHELHVFITTKFVPRGRSKLGIKFWNIVKNTEIFPKYSMKYFKIKNTVFFTSLTMVLLLYHGIR